MSVHERFRLESVSLFPSSCAGLAHVLPLGEGQGERGQPRTGNDAKPRPRGLDSARDRRFGNTALSAIKNRNNCRDPGSHPRKYR